MICPLMSKVVGYPYQDEYDRKKMDYQLFEVECQKEKCVWWSQSCVQTDLGPRETPPGCAIKLIAEK